MQDFPIWSVIYTRKRSSKVKSKILKEYKDTYMRHLTQKGISSFTPTSKKNLIGSEIYIEILRESKYVLKNVLSN